MIYWGFWWFSFARAGLQKESRKAYSRLFLRAAPCRDWRLFLFGVFAMQIISRIEAKAAGLKRFFTGEPCKKGHISERFLSGSCVQCYKERIQKEEHKAKKRESDKKYRERQNKEKRAEYFKNYYEARKEKFSERSAKYRAENKDKLSDIYKKYYSNADVKSRIISRSRMARERDGYKESNREYQKKWREKKRDEFLKENPDFVNKFGYRPQSVGYFYLLFIVAGDDTFVGYGITNRNVARITEHKKALGEFGFYIKECIVFKFDSGYDAIELERIFDKMLLDNKKLNVIGFKTESGDCDLQNFKMLEQQCLKFATDKNE